MPLACRTQPSYVLQACCMCCNLKNVYVMHLLVAGHWLSDSTEAEYVLNINNFTLCTLHAQDCTSNALPCCVLPIFAPSTQQAHNTNNCHCSSSWVSANSSKTLYAAVPAQRCNIQQFLVALPFLGATQSTAVQPDSGRSSDKLARHISSSAAVKAAGL